MRLAAGSLIFPKIMHLLHLATVMVYRELCLHLPVVLMDPRSMSMRLAAGSLILPKLMHLLHLATVVVYGELCLEEFLGCIVSSNFYSQAVCTLTC